MGTFFGQGMNFGLMGGAGGGDGSYTPDGIDQYTQFLLHMDGEDDGTSFSDTSGSDLQPGVSNTAVVIKTGEKKMGTASAYFDGAAGTKLSQDDHPGTDLKGFDWTVELWVNFSSLPTGSDYVGLICQRLNGWETVLQNSFSFYLTSSALKIKFNNGGAGLDYSTNWAPNTGQWYHLAWARDGANIRTFVDGALLNTEATAVTVNDSAQHMQIGNAADGVSNVGGNHAVHGYIDEVRISLEIARYTETFVPRTDPFSWAEPDGRFTVYAHWSADTIESGAGNVASWPDQIGTKHLLQGTEARQPTLVEDFVTGGGGWGSLPAVRFDKADTNWMSVAYGETLPQVSTMFIVFKKISDDSDSLLDSISSSDNRYYTDSNLWKADGAAVLATDTAPDTDTHVVMILWNNWSGKVRQDLTQIASGQIGANTVTGLTLGSDWQQTAGQFSDAYIMEVLILSENGDNFGNHSRRNRQGLMEKWGI